MINLLTKQAYVYLDAQASIETDLELPYILKQGKKLLSSGSCSLLTLNDLGADYIYLSSCFVNGVTDHTDIPISGNKARIDELKLRRHIDLESMVDGAYQLRYLSNTRDQISDTRIFVLEDYDLKNINDLIDAEIFPVGGLMPVEVAIAALIYHVFKSPVIAYWGRGSLSAGMFIDDDGIIRACQVALCGPEDNGHGPNIARIEDNLRGRMNNQVPENVSVVYLGETRPLNMNDELDEVSTALMSLAENDTEHILEFPELYGIAYANAKINFLGANSTAQVWTSKAASAFTKGATGLLLLVLTMFLFSSGEMYSKYQDQWQQHEEIVSTLGEIKSRIPDSAELKSLSAITDLVARAQTGLRLDAFLFWFSNQVSDEVRITSLIVDAPVVAVKKSPKKIMTKNRVDASAYKVVVEANIPGDYDKSKSRAEAFVKQISAVTRIAESQFEYAPDEGDAEHGSLLVKLTTLPADFLTFSGAK